MINIFVKIPNYLAFRVCFDGSNIVILFVQDSGPSGIRASGSGITATNTIPSTSTVVGLVVVLLKKISHNAQAASTGRQG